MKQRDRMIDKSKSAFSPDRLMDQEAFIRWYWRGMGKAQRERLKLNYVPKRFLGEMI